MKLSLAFFVAVCFAGIDASAYIPEYSLIASHAAEQHGKGVYSVEQEVTYRAAGEAYTVKETWTVANENAFRVTLEGRGALKGLVQGTMVYEGGQKFFFDPAVAGLRQQRLGEEWLEPLFYFRSSKSLRARLVNLRVAPQESLRDRQALSSEGEPGYEPPSFIKLSRVGGTTAWDISSPGNEKTHPAIWFEQDQFVMRKFRGTNVVLHANDYNKYEDGFWYPHQRLYTFGNTTVEVQTLSVRALGKLKAEDSRFRASGLSAGHDAVKLPDAPALKEFYSRFR